VIIELGGNDGLRGLAVPAIKGNLEAMIRAAKSQDIDVLLLGMRMPPNYGPVYVHAFAAMYADLAEQFAVSYVPFLLAGVASEPGMMQADGIHPTAQAQASILDNVWPEIVHLLP
jgi:acyl-CoA thioesterase-1